MREFNYQKLPDELFCNDIMNLVAAIHEYRGQQDFYIAAKPDILKSMPEFARVQSTGASNRIDGLNPSNRRLRAIVRDQDEPKTPMEFEIAGYYEVLRQIYDNHEEIFPSGQNILWMHSQLYQFNPGVEGGSYRENSREFQHRNQEAFLRKQSQSLSGDQVPEAVEALTASYWQALEDGVYDPLLLVPMFILDFLCIRPFRVGNSRMSMLLSMLLLSRSGYVVGKYVSLETFIEKTKEMYHEKLQESGQNWMESQNAYLPFVKYYLEIVCSGYEEFAYRLEYLQNRKLTKPERVKKLFDDTMKKVSKQKILEKCPDISMSTVEATLARLLKTGYIIKIGAGKNTSYVRKQ